MTSPNQYPDQATPEFAMAEDQLQMLDTFTTQLSQANYYASGDPNVFEQIVEQSVAGGASDVMQMPEATGLQLAVLSEGLGASTNPYTRMHLREALETNPLLDEEDRQVLRGAADNVDLLRQSGASEQEVVGALIQQVGQNIMYATRAEEQGKNKQALKIALLGFRAGASLRMPEMRMSEQFLHEVHTAAAR